MKVFETVFNRDNFWEFTADEFLVHPELVAEHFEIKLEDIKSISEEKDKPLRNQLKRDILPAANFYEDSIFTIDIDNIYNDQVKKTKIVNKLKKLDDCFAVKESVSGGLSAFFKFECTPAEFPFVYYKKYLELTLLLAVNIDFIPDIGRLRYLSLGEVFHYNPNSEVLTEMIEVDVLPVINANVSVEEGRRVIYGSR